MEPILYYNPTCQSSRDVMTFFHLVNFKYEKKLISLAKGDHMTLEFKEMNSLQQLPVLKEGSFVLRESEAIIKYIMDSRKIGEQYYPNNAKIRALINRYFGFHHSTFHPNLKTIMVDPCILAMNPEGLETFQTNCTEFENHFLGKKKYIAGDSFTIADIFAMNQFLTVKYVTVVCLTEFPVICEYVKRCLEMSVFQEVNQPLEEYYSWKRVPKWKENLKEQTDGWV